MKAIVCEMCGSQDLVKQDGYYVCQNCGTKYEIEAIKNQQVRIDTSEKLNNYYQLARRAKANKNAEDATKYYDLVRQEDPSSWEANYYVVFYKAMNCKVGEIGMAAESVKNCIGSTFSLVEENVNDSAERRAAVDEICHASFDISQMLENAAENWYKSINSSIQANHYSEYTNRQFAAKDIRRVVLDELCDHFGNDSTVFVSVAIPLIKAQIDSGKVSLMRLNKYESAIRKYEPNYSADAAKEEQKARLRAGVNAMQ